MNLTLVHQYIDLYKEKFSKIHSEEIYKWQAVKHFQDNWDIDHPDFAKMLAASLSRTNNLMAAGKYYPREVIIQLAEKSPAQVRSYFAALFDEGTDLIGRIESFRNSVGQLNKQLFPNNKKDFQDQRAVIVYLSLRYPDNYFFYKYTMFRDFCLKINFPYQPKMGRDESIGQFMNLCELIRDELSQDQELLRLHAKRLAADCYIDGELHILTQDFIYAVASQLSLTSDSGQSVPQPRQPTVEHKHAQDVEPQTFSVSFSPSITDHLQRERHNKRIGDLGELWVMEYERKNLIGWGQQKRAKKIEHVAKTRGDGAGYDIASFDQNGKPIFIEVKTTTGDLSQPFYITRHELERSRQEQDNYYLYRLYKFNEKTGEGHLYRINGDLSKLCQFPTQYKAGIKR